MNLKQIFELKKKRLKKVTIKSESNENLKESIEKLVSIIREDHSNELIINVLLENYKKETLKKINPKCLEAFIDDYENKGDSDDITYFFAKNSPLFSLLQTGVLYFLKSFKFVLTLSDVNAYFKKLESENLDEYLKEPLLEEVSIREIKAFLKDIVEYKLQNYDIEEQDKLLPKLGIIAADDQLKRNFSEEKPVLMFSKMKKFNQEKVMNVLKKFVFFIVILGYKFLCKNISLKEITRVLNKEDKLFFNSKFWTENLIISLIYHYTSFEVKCKITNLLNKNTSIPLVLASNRNPPKIASNPFIQFELNEKLGIFSFSMGSAQNKRIGKSDFLNYLFYTRFETNNNDPLNQWKINVDFGEDFNPKQNFAVVDSNLDIKWLGKYASLMNLLILNVVFSDLGHDKLKLIKKIKKVYEFCKKHNIYLKLILRDKNVVHVLDESEEETKYFEHWFNQEKNNIRSNILFELKEYKKYLRKKSDTTNIENQEDADSQMKEKIKKNLKKLNKIKSEDSSNIFEIYKIKNLKGKRKNFIKSETINLKKDLFDFIYNTERSKYKFTQNIFKKLLNEKNENKSKELDLFNLSKLNEAVINIYKDLKQLKQIHKSYEEGNEENFFPFNNLWQKKDQLFKKHEDLSYDEKDKKIKIKKEIDQIEKKIKIQELPSSLKNFFEIISKSKHPIILFYLFEQYLYKIQKKFKKENKNTKSFYDINLYWRNLKPFLESERSDLTFNEKQVMIKLFEELFSKGYSFELIDGDHFIYWGSIFKHFNDHFSSENQIMVMSVKGPQSSGKSTIMNLQFGTDFKSGVGKCTSGINGYAMRYEDDFEDFSTSVFERHDVPWFEVDSFKEKKTKPFSIPNFSRISNQSDLSNQSIKPEKKKYVLFLDSQGMLSKEVNSKDCDNKIGTFLLAVSQVLFINFSDDFSLPFKNLLEITNYSYSRINLGKHCLVKKQTPKNYDINDGKITKNV